MTRIYGWFCDFDHRCMSAHILQSWLLKGKNKDSDHKREQATLDISIHVFAHGYEALWLNLHVLLFRNLPCEAKKTELSRKILP